MAYRGKKLKDLKGDARRDRIKTLLANPGTRRLVPTADLPQNLARKRLLNDRLDQEVVPGSPLTERGLAREANAAVDVQYGDQKRLYERQAQATPGYYAAYLNQLRSQQQADAQRSANTAGAIGALYSSGPQAPNSQQSNVGAMQAGTVQALGAAQGNYSSALQAAAQAGGIQALQAVKAKQAELAGTMGSANQQYRSKRRSEEFTNVATAALTGQKQDTADADFSAQTGFTPAQWAQLSPSEKLDALKKASRAKAKPATPKAPPADQPYKYGYTKKEWLALPLAERQRITKANETKPGKKGKDDKPTTGPGSVSPAEEHKRVDQVDKVYGLLRNPIIELKNPTTGTVTTKRLSPTQMRDHLRAQGINPNVLRVALSRFHNKGAVGPDGISAAHALGIHVGGRWKRVKGPKKSGAEAAPQ